MNAVRIVGKEIADKVYQALQKRVTALKKKNINPHLVVFLIGENPASVAYVRQKQIKGEEIGCKVTILRYNESVTTAELEQKVKELNEDPTVHAILIQRPVPEQVDIAKLELLTSSQKDVDSFHPNSPYTFPIPLAIMNILKEVFETENVGVMRKDSIRFQPWLQAKNIVIVGKGPTGGAAIIKYFQTLKLPYTLVDSKTKNPQEIFKNADIIISAVGRANIINAEDLKPGVILIGVGIFRGTDGKLHGDYNETEIENIASYYTPTPGGVGPINVAMLFTNVLIAAEKQAKAQ